MMQEFKGTPGPWALCEEGSSDHGIDAVSAIDPKDGLEFEVCEVWGIDHDMSICEVSRSNARLIAAAPELLEALREADKTLCALQANVVDANKSEPRWDGVWDEIQKQRDAIKRATDKALGQTQQQR